MQISFLFKTATLSRKKSIQVYIQGHTTRI